MEAANTSALSFKKTGTVASKPTLQKPKVIVSVKPVVKVATSTESAQCKKYHHTATQAKPIRPTIKVDSVAPHCKRKIEATPALNPDSSKENVPNTGNAEFKQTQGKDEPQIKRTKLSVHTLSKQLPPKRSTPQKLGLARSVTKPSLMTKAKEPTSSSTTENYLPSACLPATTAVTPRRLPTFSEFVREWTEQKGTDSLSSIPKNVSANTTHISCQGFTVGRKIVQGGLESINHHRLPFKTEPVPFRFRTSERTARTPSSQAAKK